MENLLLILLGISLILSSFGVIIFKKPVHACLSFLLSLIVLAGIYLQLFAEFIAVMQILVYAGAILVIFMFVIVLFQDAHEQLEKFKAKNNLFFLGLTLFSFISVISCISYFIASPPTLPQALKADFGSVQFVGHALYLEFFFSFECVILLFLTAIVGAVYIGKRV